MGDDVSIRMDGDHRWFEFGRDERVHDAFYPLGITHAHRADFPVDPAVTCDDVSGGAALDAPDMDRGPWRIIAAAGRRVGLEFGTRFVQTRDEAGRMVDGTHPLFRPVRCGLRGR